MNTNSAHDQAAAIEQLARGVRFWKRASGLLAGLLACGVVVGVGGLRAAPSAQDIPQLKGDEPQQQQQAQVTVDDQDLDPSYSNFARVASTPEEVILDFGMNPQPFTAGVQKVAVTHKIVMSFYTAKRFAAALVLAIQRHEKAYGTIELDVRKRVISKAKAEPET